MKAVHLYGRKGAPRLAHEDAPEPEPGAGEVLVRVHAAAVTPTELVWAPTWTTQEGTPRALPLIPGHELSGEVAALGADVTEFTVGDPVYGLNDWFGDGAQAELCVARAGEIAVKPRTVDYLAAATAPISALTAWQGLFDRAHLAAGQRVLIHGASGGVGVFAVQLARWCGAHVIATASTHNVDFVRNDLGAAEVIDYRTQRFEDLARDVDVVFDAVGGDTLERSWAVLRPGGSLVTIAASEEDSRSQRTRDAFFIVAADRGQLVEIGRLIDEGVLRTTVGGVFPLAEAVQAYAAKPVRGKIVLDVARAAT
jgi:NADPH:quinone reductase-like Zn-dependent oxidoreductase